MNHPSAPAQQPDAAPRERTPPVPGAEWCNSCDRWAFPPAWLCRCNNR